jgi:two-component system, response regulator PdtaR
MRRVLVIDDHEASRRTVLAALAKNGYEIAAQATSGKIALGLAATTSPDVVLMAVGLSDLDGIQAAAAIIRARPLPIVLITSHYDSNTIKRATKSGVMGYLIKPLRDDELSPAIELAISRFKDFILLQQENETLRDNLEARKMIERAKGMLMKQRGVSEEQAYSFIQKVSMNMRKPMAEVAQAIVLARGA